MLKKIIVSLIAATSFNVIAANAVLENLYVKAGVNETTGTLGSGGNTSPGLLYDSTGTGTFNTSYDYLTPGSPFEGFTVKQDGTSYMNNNAGNMAQITGAWVGTPSSSGAVWEGGVAGAFNLRNTYSLATGQQYIGIQTRIEALVATTDLYFARYIDPDARAAAGDSSATDNVRGYSGIPDTNVIFSEALSSRYALGLYTSQSTGVNTGPSAGWSTDPSTYYTGGDYTVGTGDHTIGIAFYSSGLSIGDIVTYDYAYIFGPNAFTASTTAVTDYDPTATYTVTDVGSATDAASAPSTPTVTGTSTATITVSDTTAVSPSLPTITAAVAHHEASKSSGVQTIARETTTTVTTPMERTLITKVRTTTTWSDSTTTTSDSANTTTVTTFNDVSSSVANDSFSGRADQAEQFDIVKTGIYRNLNRNTAKYGIVDEKGRMAINTTGIKYNGQNGYNATTSIVGFNYETDLDKDTTVGFQVNRIGGKLNGSDTSDATLSGVHVGVYADFNVEGFTIENDLGNANIKNKYNRTIGPFTNSFDGKTSATWLSSRVYTPSLEGFKPFVGATVFKENTPKVNETGSIQSVQTVSGADKTSTTGEVGLAYNTKIEDVNLGVEIARTTTGIKEVLLNVSKISDDVMLSVNLGKNWYQNTTSDVIGVNLKVRF
jgi:hypothetical protein